MQICTSHRQNIANVLNIQDLIGKQKCTGLAMETVDGQRSVLQTVCEGVSDELQVLSVSTTRVDVAGLCFMC